ncbi:unnamed protein product, partial [Polarella glacialis]
NGGNASTVQAALTNITAIYSNRFAFAALKADGSVVAWGSSTQGGDASRVQAALAGVTAIYFTSSAFAAVKADGSVVAWGDDANGGYVYEEAFLRDADFLIFMGSSWSEFVVAAQTKKTTTKTTTTRYVAATTSRVGTTSETQQKASSQVMRGSITLSGKLNMVVPNASAFVKDPAAKQGIAKSLANISGVDVNKVNVALSLGTRAIVSSAAGE